MAQRFILIPVLSIQIKMFLITPYAVFDLDTNTKIKVEIFHNKQQKNIEFLLDLEIST